MKQLVQPVSGGPVELVDAPAPSIGATDVLVRTTASLVSAGTERALTQLANTSLVGKARARPDLVRQVVKRVRDEGIGSALTAVRARLASDLPLGYSAAGVVLEIGEAVSDIAVGDLVATGGAGRANHAEVQSVPGLLCTRVPNGVAPEDAAFATVASIALHGLRLGDVGPGAKVVVIGLGLMGQLALRLARASGCDAAGIDVADEAVARASAAGFSSWSDVGEDTTRAVLAWTGGRGADAIIVTASGTSSDPVRRAPAIARDRAVVVVVGDVGLDLERRPLYERELTLRFARSYGPGRYERSFEEWGVDLPGGYVPWTERRNMETVLELLARDQLVVRDLVTHRFTFDQAAEAFGVLGDRSARPVAILLSYAEPAPAPPAPIVRPATRSLGVGIVGAGSFVAAKLLPALTEAGFDQLVSVASASGTSAARLAERRGFTRVAATAAEVIDDPDVGVVVIATPHDLHAGLVVRALEAGKHVWCEKPVALSFEELDDVERAAAASEGVLFVGFNRRWSDPVARVRGHLAASGGPLVVTYRISADPVPERHWYADRRQGGRLLGEVCHFVDTCAAIVGADADAVTALARSSVEALLADDLVLSMRYPDGSVAAITYAAGGHAATPKERIEVLGRGHTAVIDDFSAVVLDGSESRVRPKDKGHERAAAAFHRAVALGERRPETWSGSSRTTLEAAASLLGHTSPG